MRQVKILEYNCETHLTGEGSYLLPSRFEVGKRGVNSIVEYDNGNFSYLVVMDNGKEYRVFLPHFVEYLKEF